MSNAREKSEVEPQTRRAFFGRLAAAAAGSAAGRAALAGATGAAVGVLPSIARAAAALPLRPAALLDPLAPGDTFGDGWRLEAAHAAHAGAFTVVVRDTRTIDARPQRIDVCRRGEPVRALAFTDGLELYLMDGGEGNTPMEPRAAEALRALAAIVAGNEARALARAPLLTHEERLERHPRAMARAAAELDPRATNERPPRTA